jgi:hypothetical protein
MGCVPVRCVGGARVPVLILGQINYTQTLVFPQDKITLPTKKAH